MAGRTEFDENKLKELIVYFARRLEPNAALGRVKLAKLLMHSDFNSFARMGRGITGATYEKWEYGHLPRELLLVERDLKADGSILEERVSYFGKTLRHLTAQRDPDMSAFSEEELAIIEGALRRYGYESATYLSEQAHRELGWKLAAWKEEIPYKTVYLGTGGVSEEDVRRGEELASLHGWN